MLGQKGTHKIKCSLPDQLEIRESPLNGWGIFGKKSFKKGELIYENKFTIARASEFPSHIELQVNEMTFVLSSHNHISPYPGGLHAVYTFDALMNHHCEASTHDKVDKDDPLKYYVFATRDLEPGEELTCNYNTFKWVNDNPFQCTCGSPKCCASVEGYSKLTARQREEIKEWTDTSAKMLQGRNIE